MLVSKQTNAEARSSSTRVRSRPYVASVIIVGGLFMLLIGIALAVSLGAARIPLDLVWGAITHFNPDNPEHQIIQELRLPRVLIGAMVGASFAVAGALMQGMTRNPMADSGLLGLNAGSGLVIAICFAFLPGLSFNQLILFAFLGAGIGAGLVFGVGSLARGSMTPVRLVLAGAAVSALLAALSEGIALYFQIGQDLAFWYAGGLSGAKWLQLKVMFPWVVGAILAALAISRSITMLSLGEDVATGLGQRTGLVKIIATIIVLVLAGSAVAVVGAVGFVGLIIPHLTRFLVGVDYRWIIPCSAILGSLLVVLADLGARIIHPPFEVPIGAIIALIGVPFFLYLARKERRVL
ncbi:iron ABC transporter permease [Paenibacillus sp. N1-5-1-14]|uniref:FecCD family ABC transporter permease n=1 Tax=Paenibacillus radicibacter TaxID=2972488 RepID=UPI00215994E2|nr:iron ABC transporter permease [Paenibacillus radicibacter]MCR8644355.1 iron ABC transporter permease [Paenibacillus radicibacter]